MIDRNTWEEGLKVEKEHKHTYEWLAGYFKKNKRLPEADQMYLHIVQDHLKEDPEYYTKLKEAKL